MSVDLEREINPSRERGRDQRSSHFAYPTYARPRIQRRENLTRSADELRIQLEEAKSLLAEAFEELKKSSSRRARSGARRPKKTRGDRPISTASG